MSIFNSIRKRVDYVLRIVDDYTLLPINSGIVIKANEVILKIIKKNDGLYVISNLEENIESINIDSQLYLTEVIDLKNLEIDKMNPIINVKLKSKPSYFFNRDGAIIKFKLVDMEKRKFNNLCIRAVINTNNYYEGQVMEDVEKDSNLIKIKEFYDELLPGDDFYIKEEGTDKGEYIRILRKKKEEIVLNERVVDSYSKGSKICRAFITKCDEGGNVIVYFRKLLRNNTNIEIYICIQDYVKKIDVNIEPVCFLDIGNITLQ